MHILLPALPHVADLTPGLRVMVGLLGSLLCATLAVGRPRPHGAIGTWRTQVTSWWRILPLAFVAWALHPFGAPMLALVISALAAHELAALAAPGSAPLLRRRFLMLIAVQAALSFLDLSLWNSALMLALMAATLAAWGRAGDRDALLTALFATQSAGLGSLTALAPPAIPLAVSASWFLYLCSVTALNDVGQFIAGKLFGRHKLATRISPNKTWQGLGGGLAMSAGISVAVGHALALAPWPWLAGMGLVLSVAGLLGDLAFSAGKRALGVKDYSRLIPGHGGILDRVDSLVLTAPVLLLALRLA